MKRKDLLNFCQNFKGIDRLRDILVAYVSWIQFSIFKMDLGEIVYEDAEET